MEIKTLTGFYQIARERIQLPSELMNLFGTMTRRSRCRVNAGLMDDNPFRIAKRQKRRFCHSVQKLFLIKFGDRRIQQIRWKIQTSI
jgi:hypothetical protein